MILNIFYLHNTDFNILFDIYRYIPNNNVLVEFKDKSMLTYSTELMD